ncbi:helix-turn-helix domain-containing protein [Xylella fastidiosa]|uniref:Helix-turn-helix domain-containing protein n=1 Tax=Xylella fastidiosa subsp. fastidiosa TaxID=644356 RepID=A0AAJ5R0M7_XYLFS|nr:RodZ family helix-turn-helix domain-containing protein [Xylella fastidiosa]WCF27771.1 helix-turn-helix domain-containing protein [Xylella fastidiosa subsp. fastidiosa]
MISDFDPNPSEHDSNPDPFEHAKGCGQRLRDARMAVGLTVEDVATSLRMPIQIVRSLEGENWQRLGAPVFVRGQLRGYARFLNIDLDPLLEQAFSAEIEPAELVSYAHMQRGRHLLESVTRKAMYVVITGVLAVPVWYAMRSSFEPRVPRTASLEVVPEQSKSEALGGTSPDSGGSSDSTAPFIASIAPVPRNNAMPSEQGGGLTLSFKGDSWIEVVAPDGSPIEKALIPAGQVRHYVLGQVGRVVLGNAVAVEVQESGNIVDLTRYRRANVARFAVSSDGSVMPVPR